MFSPLFLLLQNVFETPPSNLDFLSSLSPRVFLDLR